MVWRSNVDGVDTWCGIDILFHGGSGGLRRTVATEYGTNELLNILHGFCETNGQTIRFRSVETGHGFVCIAAESPHADHHFQFWEPLPDLLAHSPRRRERVRRERRNAGHVARTGFDQGEPFKPFIGRSTGDGKGQNREPLLLQELSQYRARELIGAIMGRKAESSGRWDGPRHLVYARNFQRMRCPPVDTRKTRRPFR